MKLESMKEQAIHAIQQLPSDTSYEDMIYRLYVLESIRKGTEDVQKGHTITQDQLIEESKKW